MSAKLLKLQGLRHFLLTQLEGLSLAQLNEIPGGYRNNIIWNLAHLGAAVQSLCYGRAGLPPTISDEYVSPYLPGTKPERFLDEAAVEAIKAISLAALDQLALDLAARKFETYTSSAFIQQRYGVAVNSIDDALDFLIYHEGFHTGYVLALKRLIQGQGS